MLTFDDHVKDICKKAKKKLRTLARTTPYMKAKTKNLLVNSFFSPQFNYCPLIRMLHSHQNSNSVRHLHERFLQLSYNYKLSSFMNY